MGKGAKVARVQTEEGAGVGDGTRDVALGDGAQDESDGAKTIDTSDGSSGRE